MYPAEQIAAVEDPDGHSAISFPAWLAMLDRACAVTGDPDLALKVGERFRVRHLGHVGFVLMSCRTLEEVVAQAERYNRLIGGVGGALVERLGPTGQLRLEWPAHAPPPPPAVEQIFMAATATLARWLADRPDLCWDVSFRCERPDDLRNYERIFGGNIRFGQDETKLSFPAVFLKLPVALANREIHDAAVTQAEAMLQDLTGEPEFLRSVKTALAKDLAAGRASLGSLSERLHLSPRTLHRRLAEHGCSFRDVLNQTRRTRAETYLRDPTITLAEVAFMLGYSEQSTFQHAFRRWVGVTPGEFRARELAE